jgi:hypothetical protein
MIKRTKQGVRDLSDIGPKDTNKVKPIVIPQQCEHRRMRECHKGCGHYVCPDCGFFYDNASDG